MPCAITSICGQAHARSDAQYPQWYPRSAWSWSWGRRHPRRCGPEAVCPSLCLTTPARLPRALAQTYRFGQCPPVSGRL